jgi:hypothetical protein
MKLCAENKGHNPISTIIVTLLPSSGWKVPLNNPVMGDVSYFGRYRVLNSELECEGDSGKAGEYVLPLLYSQD